MPRDAHKADAEKKRAEKKAAKKDAADKAKSLVDRPEHDLTPVSERMENISKLTEAEFRGLIRKLREESKLSIEAFLWMGSRLSSQLSRIETLLETWRPMHPSELLDLMKAHYLLETGEELDEWLVKNHKPPLAQQNLDQYVETGKYTRERMDKKAAKNDGEEDLGDPPICPKCNLPMQVRSGKLGRFWGCPNYRSAGCRETVDIDPKPWGGGSGGGSTPGAPPQTEPTADGGEFVEF